MILLQRPKYFATQILITLFLTLQIVACSNEDLAKTIIDDTSSSASNDSSTPDTEARTDINLSWAAPSQREDNEPISLSEIAGYKVYFGTARRNYTSNVNINDGTADGYTFNNLSAGTYYFALTTYDTAGRESQYSAEVKIIV